MYKLNISDLIRKPKKRKLKLSEIFYIKKKKIKKKKIKK